ncbi:MAG: iron-sulfur cluster assembly protein [Nitrososphaerota archaeon]|nr:iron-sulfur cluster assembly protein [Candidatus Bathyarchaeota archaeon]MDW8062123.1 iron-sulfur cluster assembly protein [Nitrososphaerota archaeon]
MPVDESKLSEEEKVVYDALRDILDPEFGFSIVDAGFIDEVKVEDGRVKVVYHLSAPFCPSIFALQIGLNIKYKLHSIPFVRESEVVLIDHWQSEEINKAIKEYKP